MRSILEALQSGRTGMRRKRRIGKDLFGAFLLLVSKADRRLLSPGRSLR